MRNQLFAARWAAIGALATVAWIAPALAQASPTNVCGERGATINGTSGSDVINGTDSDDVISAGAGDDVVNGLGGFDYICGGAGVDIVDGGAGTDWLSGGRGDDSLQAGADEGELVGCYDRCDYLDGGAGNDHIDGGTGTASDLIFLSGAHDTRVNLKRGTARGDGHDTLTSVESVQVLYGSVSDDVLIGSPDRNVFWSGLGEDVIKGRGGNDDVNEYGGDSEGSDADVVRGGRGDDVIYVYDGADDVRSGSGDDTVNAMGEPDAAAEYRLGPGNDWLNQQYASGAPIYVWAGPGNDFAGVVTQAYLKGGNGNDSLQGSPFDDVLDGGPGIDWGTAGAGQDSCPSIEVLTDCESWQPATGGRGEIDAASGVTM